MLKQVFSVYDKKAKIFCQPFYAENSEVAIRSFAYAANDKTVDLGRYPTDFDLFKLGSFDDQTGKFDLHEPEHLASAFTLVNEEV